jgi:hypothetical protein
MRYRDSIWKSSNDLTQSKEIKRLKHNAVDSVEIKYRTLFYKIIDQLLNHLTECFSSTEVTEFFGSLNCKKFDVYTLKYNFPDHLV